MKVDKHISPLTSIEHAKVAHYLADVLIEEVRTVPEHGGKIVADQLKRLRNVIWSDTPSSISTLERDTAAREKIYSNVLAELTTPEKRQRFMEAFAKMGHLYEMSGLIARDNVFAKLIKDGEEIPGGVQQFLRENALDAASAVERLNKPVFEIVFTAHPTNVNAPESIKRLRELGVDIDRVRRDDQTATARKGVEAYLREKLLMEEDGHPKNFSVRDETDFMLYYLGNVYEDLPRVYERFDKPLTQQGGYNPLQLNLQMRFASWGSSGDKDGNNKVNADTTLEAIALHRHAIVKRYLEDVVRLGAPELGEWRKTLERTQKALGDVISELATQRTTGQMLPQGRFDGLSKRIAKTAPDAKEFESTLTALYEKHKNPAVLSLLRRARTFGFHFSHIEYRETAEEYTRVVGILVPGYNALDDAGRARKLTEILQTPGEAARLLKAAHTKIKQGAGKPYSNDDAAPIAYQTIKRMELARDHPDMIVDNVLAECKGASSMLEAQFLQAAVEKDGKRPVLGIVPLFEDPDTLKHVGSIMQEIYDNPAYQSHLNTLAYTRNVPVTQQVQLAHSDNTRRSGLPAARALIAKAHEVVRKISDDRNIGIQFYEGGSQSDPYRGGVRALSAMVDEYGLHDFAKFTFQGGDLLNWLNYTPSLMRLFTRNLSHSAAGPQKAESRNIINHTDAIASAALEDTLKDYQDNVFKKDKIGRLLAVLEDASGAAGSRSPSRKGGSGAKKVEIDPDDGIRTITFSENLQHGGLNPSWFGVASIYENLRQRLQALPEMSAVDRTDRANGELATLNKSDKAAVIRHFYKHSPKFKDVMDRTAFAVAQTSIEKLKRYHPELEGHPFMQRVEEEYREAAALAYAAFKGKPIEAAEGLAANPTTTQLQQVVKEAYSHLHKLFDDKLNYRDFVLMAKHAWEGDFATAPLLERTMHCSLDTVVHSRYPTVDDQTYSRKLAEMLGKTNGNGTHAARTRTAHPTAGGQLAAG